MITVNCGGHGHPRQATADELEHRHLCRSILHGHAVRMQTQVCAASVDILIVGVSEVTVHNLLRQGEWPIESRVNVASVPDQGTRKGFK